MFNHGELQDKFRQQCNKTEAGGGVVKQLQNKNTSTHIRLYQETVSVEFTHMHTVQTEGFGRDTKFSIIQAKRLPYDRKTEEHTNPNKKTKLSLSRSSVTFNK